VSKDGDIKEGQTGATIQCSTGDKIDAKEDEKVTSESMEKSKAGWKEVGLDPKVQVGEEKGL